jgi:hypothetical protein
MVAWRILREERLRSQARVAALAAEIHGEDSSAVEYSAHDGTGELILDGGPLPAQSATMFTARPERSWLPLVATVTALVLAAALAASFLFVASGERPVPAKSATASATTTPHPSPSATPLQLVALGHERDADGLTVRGVLRNPSSGTPVSHLSAVVLLFNRDGGLVGTGRAEVQSATLGPGGETTFVVTVSGASNVQRYRVSFRTQDDIVPHVDLRS